ncbi:CAP domain-containing protein [Aliterella atlantica]|uniref:Serine protease n=1 Tax=Aliterella atlantica CENA595 TaxID=1618023 RepID=A0A0D8ZNR9_9CYAN|nr:CAP domain-containing protein [Aliterella atlantica]KJH70134.1 serine protease [Aliterella atlantica CENA595]
MPKLPVGILLAILATASGLTSCDIPLNADIMPTPETIAAVPPSSLEQSIHQQINQYRQSRKLPPLQLDARISQQAKIHSQAMANGKVPFSHQGFDTRISAIRRQIRYRAAAENVAYNQGYSNPAKQAVEGWIKSQGHRVNIEGQYNLTGIGVAKNAKNEYYFTQIFINRP